MTLADRRLRRFFAARGYPDPASITQQRTIWPAGATASSWSIAPGLNLRTPMPKSATDLVTYFAR